METTIALFIPKQKQKHLYAKEICHLIKAVIEKEHLIKIFRFVGTDKSVTHVQKKNAKHEQSLAIIRIDVFNIIYY